MNGRDEKLKALLAAGKISQGQYDEMRSVLCPEDYPGPASHLSQVPTVIPMEAGASPDLVASNREEWPILFWTYLVIATIFFVFSPYTHQLDEIKTAILFTVPPILLLFALRDLSFADVGLRRKHGILLLGLFTVSQVVSLLVNPDIWLAGERELWFQVGCLTFTFVLSCYLRGENRILGAIRFLVWLGLGSVLAAFILHFPFWETIFGGKHSSTPRTGQIAQWETLAYTLSAAKETYSTVLNSEFYAVFLAMAIPFSLSLLFLETQHSRRTHAATAFILMSICMGLTMQPIPMVIVGAIELPLFLFLGFRTSLGSSFRSRFSKIAWLALPVSGLLLIQAFRLATSLIKFVDTRWVIWRGGLMVWMFGTDASQSNLNWLSLLLGTGPYGFRAYFPLFRQPDYFDHQINNVTSSAHNFYIDMLCENGIIGFTCFSALLIWVMRRAWMQIRSNTAPVIAGAQLAAFSGLAAMLFLNFVSPATRWSVDAVIFWSLIGISIATNVSGNAAENTKSDSVGHSGFPFSRWVKPALFAFGFFFLFRSFPQGIYYFRASVENAKGLNDMDSAELEKGSQKMALLETATRRFEKAITLNPTFATSYYKAAHAYNQLGQPEKCIETYEALSKLEPNYSEIHLNLGIVYSAKAMTMEGEAATQLLEKAVGEIREAARQSLKPTHQRIAGHILEQLAERRQKEGNTDQAKALYREARTHYQLILDYTPKLAEFVADKKEWEQVAHARIAAINAIVEGSANDTPTEKLSERAQ
ncbi:MAG: tetratricopeptide repeat protein [Candidatus Sumerlaeaceae bacterium]|nr:tetratricopeptide repeat protein [Candidatus Sumerlaeaceae bacterium]